MKKPKNKPNKTRVKSGATGRAARTVVQKKLNWDEFNFIENLIVACVLPWRTVPKESGVRFKISVAKNHKAFCVLAHIDRIRDPILNPDVPRPDYLTIYATTSMCICTIIEMKGKCEAGLDRGIDQIRTLRDVLSKEVREHLPTKMRTAVQGLLLMPPNSQVPMRRIVREAQKGLTILALSYHNRAELFPYVSKMNRLGERYQHRSLTDAGLREIEKLVAESAMSGRPADSCVEKCRREAGAPGVHVNFALAGTKKYAALCAAPDIHGIGVPDNEWEAWVDHGLQDVGIREVFELSRI